MLTTSPGLDQAQKSNKGRGSMRVMVGEFVCIYVCACTGVSLW